MTNNTQSQQIVLEYGTYYLLWVIGAGMIVSEIEIGEDLEEGVSVLREQGASISDELLEDARLLRDEGDGDKTPRHAL